MTVPQKNQVAAPNASPFAAPSQQQQQPAAADAPRLQKLDHQGNNELQLKGGGWKSICTGGICAFMCWKCCCDSDDSDTE
ncbi:hypothetical protein GGF46_004480 [Coemansia sp. RSA 552]|nr:hypothetical protein GGF46_004480 [Coemansia sp. RSA 552]